MWLVGDGWMSDVNENMKEAIRSVADDHGPEEATKAVYSELDVETIAEANEVVREALPTTDGRGRHSMDYCLRCNPEWNGKYGDEGTEAIAKYKVPNIRGEDQWSTGWHGVCESCAHVVDRQGYTLHPLPGYEDHELFAEEEPIQHDCEDPSWTKVSMVTEAGGFDWVECDDCGIYAKRHGMNQIEVIGFERE